MWRDIESLRKFTWNTIHKRFRLRNAEWFEPLGKAYLVIWPVAEGHLPGGQEALDRLAQLRQTGPTDQVFGTEAIRPLTSVAAG